VSDWLTQRTWFLPLLKPENLWRGFCEELDRFSSYPESPLFGEGITRLSAGLATSAKLDPLGCLIAYRDIRNSIRNRLLIRRTLENRPEVTATPLRKTVVIAGLPRTGSTLLQRLIALDPQFRALKLREGLKPYMPDEPIPPLFDARLSLQLLLLRTRSPQLHTIHPTSPRSAEECVYLLKQTMVSVTYAVFYDIPNYADWLSDLNLTPTYEYLYAAYQYLQGTDNSRRWILKAPVHIFALESILDVFSDAVVIQTHRDPATVLASQCSLTAAARLISSRDVNPSDIGPFLLNKIQLGLSRVLASRGTADAEGRFIDISYTKLVDDPIEQIQSIYQKLDARLSPRVATAMRAWLASDKRRRHRVHEYTLSAFGLPDRNQVEEALSPYSDTFARFL
jgi:hypothetical protein